jgi:hypothetical protein
MNWALADPMDAGAKEKTTMESFMVGFCAMASCC